ncbi:MAG: 30S ribosomal protein S12 methylthiotransferase RimO [Sedimentisphaerales bacterium]|nr:30S ribosomal protein S12 methylthiotransferase RimO [Sedimentisphaerales bacterium]
MSMTNKSNKKALAVGFVALGCPKNVVDSEKMLALIAEKGFIVGADIDNADIVVINTCGFIQPAVDEAEEVISRALGKKRKGKIKKIVVAGCLPQRQKQQLLQKFGQIDAVVELGQRDNIAEIIENLFGDSQMRFYQSPVGWTDNTQDDTDRLLINSAHWAYLRISEGCDKFCSFCTIPAIKGKFRSKPLDNIIVEANQLASAGIVELSVIAQDSANYGKDSNQKDGLVKVINELEKIDSLGWIRLMYLNPSGIDEILIETIAKSKKVVHYIDMPIQHINSDILKRMYRSDTKEKITGLIEKLRKSIPDCILRTTVIVGFPGETEKQFAELLDFIKEVRFDALGCFAYWPEQGTKAAQLPDQIPQDVKENRREELMLAQQKIAFAKNKAHQGQVLEFLIDQIQPDGLAIGRFYGQAPHIDSICAVNNCKAEPGSFIKAKVTGYQDYDLLADAEM